MTRVEQPDNSLPQNHTTEFTDTFLVFREQEYVVFSQKSEFGQRCLRSNQSTDLQRPIDFHVPYTTEGNLFESAGCLLSLLSLIPGLGFIGFIALLIGNDLSKKRNRQTQRHITVPYIPRYRIAPAWCVSGILTVLWLIVLAVMVVLQYQSEDTKGAYVIMGLCIIIPIGLIHWMVSGIWSPKHGFNCVAVQHGFYFITGAHPEYISRLPYWPGIKTALELQTSYSHMLSTPNSNMTFGHLKRLNDQCIQCGIPVLNPDLLPKDHTVIGPQLDSIHALQQNALLSSQSDHIPDDLEPEEIEQFQQSIEHIEAVHEHGHDVWAHRNKLVVTPTSVFPNYCPTDNLPSPQDFYPHVLTAWHGVWTRWLLLLPGAMLLSALIPLHRLIIPIPLSPDVLRRIKAHQDAHWGATMAFWGFTGLFGLIFFVAYMAFETHWDTFSVCMVSVFMITSVPSWLIQRYHMLRLQLFTIHAVHDEFFLLNGACEPFLNRLPPYNHPHQPE